MGGSFKFHVQDSFLEYFFGEIWRFEKRIALSEKSQLQQQKKYGAPYKMILRVKHPTLTHTAKPANRAGLLAVQKAYRINDNSEKAQR